MCEFAYTSENETERITARMAAWLVLERRTRAGVDGFGSAQEVVHSRFLRGARCLRAHLIEHAVGGCLGRTAGHLEKRNSPDGERMQIVSPHAHRPQRSALRRTATSNSFVRNAKTALTTHTLKQSTEAERRFVLPLCLP